MSMIRHLDGTGEMDDVVLLHSARHTDDVIFGSELRDLAGRHERMRLHEQHTKDNGRIGTDDLDRLCPDWRERETYVSGPSEMLDAFMSTGSMRDSVNTCTLNAFSPRSDLATARRAPAERSASSSPGPQPSRTARRPFSWPGRTPVFSCPTAAARASAIPVSESCAQAACEISGTAKSTGRWGRW